MVELGWAMQPLRSRPGLDRGSLLWGGYLGCRFGRQAKQWRDQLLCLRLRPKVPNHQGPGAYARLYAGGCLTPRGEFDPKEETGMPCSSIAPTATGPPAS